MELTKFNILNSSLERSSLAWKMYSCTLYGFLVSLLLSFHQFYYLLSVYCWPINYMWEFLQIYATISQLEIAGVEFCSAQNLFKFIYICHLYKYQLCTELEVPAVYFHLGRVCPWYNVDHNKYTCFELLMLMLIYLFFRNTWIWISTSSNYIQDMCIAFIYFSLLITEKA